MREARSVQNSIQAGTLRFAVRHEITALLSGSIAAQNQESPLSGCSMRSSGLMRSLCLKT
jgi:hypothetical protein